MTTNVRLKFKKKNKVSRDKITEIAYGKLNIPLTRLYDSPDGYKAVCKDLNDVDILLSQKSIEIFDKEGIIVITPPEIKAQRSVFIRNLDYTIGQHSPEDIKDEIEGKNSWIKIEEVVKIKDYTHVIKIRFTETNITDKVLDKGFLAFKMSVIPEHITREKFVSLLTCFTCYQMEDHATKDCPLKDTKLCSECAEEGHRFTDCESGMRKACLNCKRIGNNFNTHRTLAMSCPYKKELINKKTENEKDMKEKKQNTTYAKIAKMAVTEVKQPLHTTEINLSEYKHYKILFSIVHSHIMNIITPGTYNIELNRMLEANGLPKMIFPENPHSTRLLGATATLDLSEVITTARRESDETVEMEIQVGDKEQKERQDTVEMEIQKDDKEEKTKVEASARVKKTTGTVPKERKEPKPQRKQEKQKELISDDSNQEVDVMNSDESETIEEQMEIKIKHPNTVKEIGLTFYVGEQHHYPTKNMSYDKILEGLDKRTIKYLYEANLEEHYVEELLKNQQLIIYHTDFKRIDRKKFVSIRNGYINRKHVEQEAKSKKI